MEKSNRKASSTMRGWKSLTRLLGHLVSSLSRKKNSANDSMRTSTAEAIAAMWKGSSYTSDRTAAKSGSVRTAISSEMNLSLMSAQELIETLAAMTPKEYKIIFFACRFTGKSNKADISVISNMGDAGVATFCEETLEAIRKGKTQKIPNPRKTRNN